MTFSSSFNGCLFLASFVTVLALSTPCPSVSIVTGGVYGSSGDARLDENPVKDGALARVDAFSDSLAMREKVDFLLTPVLMVRDRFDQSTFVTHPIE